MIVFNTKYWPVVYFYIDNEKMNDEMFEEYKRTYLTILLKCKKEKEKIILISDLNNQGNLPIKYVVKQAYFNNKIHKFNEQYVSIVCVYLQNQSFKKILDIYFSICTPCCPYKVCSSFDIINDFMNPYHKFDTHVFEKLEPYLENITIDKPYKEIKSVIHQNL
jgi:hypothetical protein